MMSLPESFLKLIESYNAPQLAGLSGALLAEPSVAVRVNHLKGGSEPAGCEAVPWCADGFYLPGRIGFTFDPAWHQGLYYVQDASSMIVAHVVRSLTADGKAVRLLDACAAPGGKTTAALSVLPEGSAVVANEYVAARCAVLRENLAKWGYGEVAVAQGDTAAFRKAPGAFDIIIADVPCSGEGMMRKDAEAVEQWSPALVRQCAARQREIVDNLWEALAPGGYLVYSTCTFNRDENECMVAYLTDRHGAENVAVPVDPSWGIAPGIDTTNDCMRFIPGLIRGEGLFMAVVRKPVTAVAVGSKPDRKGKSKGKKKAPAADVPDAVRQWLNCQAEWSIEGDTVLAHPADVADAGLPWRASLPVATVKGRDFIPTQQLAMSRRLNAAAFPAVEVDSATAIAYLGCRAVALAPDVPRGIVLLTHRRHPLGFVKNLGNRANNLYPKAWRILASDAVERRTSLATNVFKIAKS